MKIFGVVLGSQQNSRKEAEFPHTPPQYMHDALSTSHTTVAHLLQSMSQHSHMIIIQSAYFMLELTFDIVYFMDLDKYIVMCIHLCHIIENTLS